MKPSIASSRIAVEGRNCWKRPIAHRAAMLVDGQACFEAFADAMERARRSICIAGWDIHSRARLRNRDAREDLPSELGEFLSALARRRRGLRIWVLSWDFSMIYALEREPLPILHMGWRTHRRVRFHLDGNHPLGACHHQKLIVVDDAVAFCGGLDLTISRWDTSGHAASDPQRVLPSGEPYGPFHDVQMVVDGPAARAIGDLFRWRWRRATGWRLPRRLSASDPWPRRVPVLLRDIPVAIARTHPVCDDEAEVREVESLYLDGIAAARRSLYIENQYFTSARMGEAIARRLQEPDGPEVVVVSPLRLSGWLEESTMGMLRGRLIHRLRQADRHGRLRLVHPVVPGCEDPGVNVHSKVMVVDDRALRIGSANLSNRSMGLDTECDLMVESDGDPATARAIAAARDRLIAEHLGRPVEDVQREIVARGSLVAGLDACSGGARDLRALPSPPEQSWLAEIVPEDIVDPVRPIEAESLADRIVPVRPGRRLAAIMGAGLVLLLALALFGAESHWRFLGILLDPIAWLDGPLARSSALPTPLLVLGGYLLGGLLILPITLMIVETAILFGPFWGFVFAWMGSMASALAFYGVGRALGRDRLARLPGRRLERLRRWVTQRGMFAIVVARVLPLAPFTVVNLLAGAARLRFRDYLIGTMIGMTPGIALMTALGDQLGRTLRERSFTQVLILIGVAAATLAGAWAMQRRVSRAAAPAGTGAAADRPEPARRAG